MSSSFRGAWPLCVALAGLVLLAGCGAEREGDDAVAPSSTPHVFLFTIESLRTDHVGAYGGRSGTRPDEPITPALDAFAREAVLYENAHSVTSWTLSSHASLFTGLYPTAHQTRRPRSRLGDDYVTLAERLAEVGYQTAAVVSGPYLRANYNLTQGFERIDDSSANPLQPRAHSDVTNPAVERGLLRFVELERDTARPLFLFAYLWDPHFDFLPPTPYDRLFVDESCELIDVHDFDVSDRIHPGIRAGQLSYVLSQYDGEIRATDEMLGRFFGLLRDRGLWDDSLIIVTADHGEEFFDHGEKGHKKNLYDETVHVPLLVKYPKGLAAAPAAGTRDPRLVSLVDVVPTVLEAMGRGVPQPVQGRSLLRPAEPDRAIFFELLSVEYLQGPGEIEAEAEAWVAVRRGDDKLVARKAPRGESTFELFDIAADPGERRNLAEERAAQVEALRVLASEQLARSAEVAGAFEAGRQAELSDSERARLCALGYLQADASSGACAELR